MYNQGMVLYETTLSKRNYFMTLNISDFAIVYLDGKKITTLNRGVTNLQKMNVSCEQYSCQLSILVEAMGHVNYDHHMEIDRKGILAVKDDIQTEFKWNVYKYPL